MNRNPRLRGGTSPRVWVATFLTRAREMLRSRRATRLASVFLQPLAGVILIHGAWIGLPLWFVVAQDLRRAMFAVLGLLIGEGARLLLRVDDRPGSEGCLKTNALLTTLAVAWLLPEEGYSLGVQLALVATAAAIASILATAIIRAIDNTILPPLVWGYCAIAGILFLIFPELAATASLATDWGVLPVSATDWVEAFFRTLGAFLFMPQVVPGMVIAATILLWSRTMFLAGVIGWIVGILTALALVELGVLFYWLPTAYNFFLAGMALGSVYFLPGWASLLVAGFAGGIAAFAAVGLQHFLQFSAAAYLPIPLSLTVWAGIGALQFAAKRGAPSPNRLQTLKPEDAWWLTALDGVKWGHREALLVVPVAGEVEITQGFSGGLTHVGRWRHALDFQRVAPKTHRGRINDAIFGAPVLAPAPGLVERIRNNVPDNDFGVSNYADNWGNHVVIALDAGGWALLAHLRQGSVTVQVGVRVGLGTILAEVGNSGRSPTPHLHLQIQNGPEPGEPTRPFRLANYLYAERAGEPLTNWAAVAMPVEGAVVKAAKSSPRVHRLLAGMPPGKALWSVEIEGDVDAAFKPPGGSTSLRIDVTLDSAGRQVSMDRSGGGMVARFDADAWRVVDLDSDASAFLRIVSIAVPSVPYAVEKGISWSDVALYRPGSSLRWLLNSLLPYRTAPFINLRSRCLSAPSDSDDMLEIETRPETEDAHLPRKMVSQFRMGEGISRIAVEFAHGSLTYSLYSFTPASAHPLAAASD